MSTMGLTRNQIIILALLAIFTCIVIAFGGYFVWATALKTTPEPTPVPTQLAPSTKLPTATDTPELSPTPEAMDDSLERVKRVGTLVVGTSADYPPFEYYAPDFKLDGFDVTLITEIASRMGVQVEIRDMVFDGLINALALKQIDVAIAAISVTPERQGLVNFSNVYLISQDGVLTQQDSLITTISRLEELADKQVGVQYSTVHERWLRENLVDKGLMPGSYLKVYPRIDTAVEDLNGKRLDLVVMDLLPAQQFLTQGGLKIVGQGLNQQQYAIALRHEDGTLRLEINRILTELFDQGKLSALAQEYLGISPDQLPPPVAPSPAPPQPTATPPACLDGMEFVRELTYPDFKMTNPPEFPPGTPFQKGWRIRNIGTCTWDSSYILSYVGGNTPSSSMGGAPTPIIGTVPPGAEYDMYVNLVSPLQPGIYQGFWQLNNSKGIPFGERLWVGIKVVPFKPGTPTPEPGTPVIQRFDLIPNDQITLGQCVDVWWNVKGPVNNIKIFRNDLLLRDGAPVKGTLRDCPTSTGQMLYRLEAAGPGGTPSAADDVLVVEPATGVPTDTPTATLSPEETPTPTQPVPPTIVNFEVQPGQINVSQCVDVMWKVDGEVDLIQIKRNEDIILDNAADIGNLPDCPTQAGTYIYRIDASNQAGQSAFSEKSVTVKSSTASLSPDVVGGIWRLASQSAPRLIAWLQEVYTLN